MQIVISHLLIIVQIKVEIIGWEVANLNLVWAHKAAEIWLACEVAFTRHPAKTKAETEKGGSRRGSV